MQNKVVKMLCKECFQTFTHLSPSINTAVKNCLDKNEELRT